MSTCSRGQAKEGDPCKDVSFYDYKPVEEPIDEPKVDDNAKNEDNNGD